jgi:hypothetical protein
LRVWLLSTLVVALVAAGAAGAALLAWPTVGIAASQSGLAAVSLPGFSGDVERVSVAGTDGKKLPVGVARGVVWPHVRLPAGQRVRVTVEVRRPGWIGWLVGARVERTVTLVTPVAHLRSTLLRPKRGSPVAVRFAEPVSRVTTGRTKRRGLGSGRTVVPLGVVASGKASAGTTMVSAAARRWETLSTPVRVSWFVAGGWYRVDFLWPEKRVVVEADGLAKYRNDWRALVEEKRRQEYLERAGYRVIRLLGAGGWGRSSRLSMIRSIAGSP